MLRLFNLGGSGNGESAPAPAHAEATLLDRLADAVLTIDAADRITYANRAAGELLRQAPDKLVGDELLSLFVRESRDTVRFAQSAARDGLPQRFDADLVRGGGDACTVSVSAAPLGDAEGGTVLTLRDVTGERRAHNELALSEARYRHLFEDASDAIMTFDSLGRFTSVNDAGERISGYPRDELIGRFFGPLLPLSELPRAVLEFRRALSGSPGQFESVVVRKDGERRHITITYSCPQRSREVLCLIRDATEEKQLQQQLIQSEKMAAIGQLVSGVAHELNNPLASISAFAQLLLVDRTLSPQALHSAEVISSEARRASRIVYNLLTFARQHKAEKTFASVNQVLENTLELRAYELNVRGILLERDFEQPAPSTMLDVYQFQQVILNLVTNAEQAMAEVERPHHRLTIRTRTLGDTIRVEVEDTGPGIAPESLERIFNPFYTTKAVGQGTGLGLSISLGIIGEHGGRIWAEHVPGGGGRFCIDLPCVPATVPAPAALPAPRAALPAGLRILIADDEAPIRSALTRFLEQSGHEAVAVASGREALAVAARERFDAILLDMRMPDISGKQVFEQWRTEHPELTRKVVFLTGDIVSRDLHQFLADSGQPFIAKPFDLDAVLQILPRPR